MQFESSGMSSVTVTACASAVAARASQRLGSDGAQIAHFGLAVCPG